MAAKPRQSHAEVATFLQFLRDTDRIDELDVLLSVLSERERKLIRVRYGLPGGQKPTPAEISRKFGVPIERVHELQQIALAKLQQASIIPPVAFPLTEQALSVSAQVDRKLVDYFRSHPAAMRTMDRRLFEELVAEVWAGFGYEVELTQQTRDGGKDIIAVRNAHVSERFLIECKRPNPGNPIGVLPVRALYGIKISEGATKAILATTTHFSPDAKQMFEKHRWELEGKDFDGLVGWLDMYLRASANDSSPKYAIHRIVSGGQTGADRAGLDWAIENGIPHGGFCPKGRLAEDGAIPDRYELTETRSKNYLDRTELNVRESDGTVIFTLTDKLSGGSKRTAEFAMVHNKPFLHLWQTAPLPVSAAAVRTFLEDHQIAVLNIAGSRKSKEPGVGDFVRSALTEAFKT